MENLFYNGNDRSTNMDKNALRAMDLIMAQYEAIAWHHLSPDNPKVTLGINNKLCRFCLKTRPEVSFRQVAHALPHCIGNNVLFTYNECDSCNHKFGRLLENHFANFMNLDHTIVGVKGKKGFPKYKMDNADIETTGNFIEWKDVPPENIVHDPAAGITRITQKMPGYIPVGIYKTLVKSAITLMPENEMVHLERTLEWINEEKHGGSRFFLDSLCLLHGKVGSTERDPNISAILVRRKAATVKSYPYLMFRLTYGAFMFQLPIPLCDRDAADCFSNFPYIPTLTDLRYGFNRMQLGKMNLRNTEVVRTEMTVTIKDLDGSGTIQYVDE